MCDALTKGTSKELLLLPAAIYWGHLWECVCTNLNQVNDYVHVIGQEMYVKNYSTMI